MSTDHIRYDLLVQDALRSVVRKVMGDVARNGLPGEHHFYISFRTEAPGVRISHRLRERHPEEMTIVLQHQFWDLGITEHSFEVGLSFGGVPERLLVPFDALTGFFDPSVQFGLKFESTEAEAENDDGVPANAAPKTGTIPLAPPPPAGGRLTTPSEPAAKKSPKNSASEPAELPPKKEPAKGKKAGKADSAEETPEKAKPADGSAEVLSLDAFRKKK